jgi:hypothetical protein
MPRERITRRKKDIPRVLREKKDRAGAKLAAGKRKKKK